LAVASGALGPAELGTAGLESVEARAPAVAEPEVADVGDAGETSRSPNQAVDVADAVPGSPLDTEEVDTEEVEVERQCCTLLVNG